MFSQSTGAVWQVFPEFGNVVGKTTAEPEVVPGQLFGAVVTEVIVYVPAAKPEAEFVVETFGVQWNW